MENKKTLDIGEMVAMEMGGTVKDVNSDGTVRVAVPDPQTGEEVDRTLDLPKMMADQGLDPAKVNIKYNDPEMAVDASNLSFATKVQLSLAGDDAQGALKVLADEYGESNVQMTANGLVVKEKGVWKKADSSLLSDLTANLPEVGAGIAGRAAGAKAGALAGAVFGPAGAVAGGIIGGLGGGALGSALATVIKDKGAEAVGIRTEYDAEKAQEVLAKELAWNLAIDTTLGAAGAAWRGFGKPIVKAMGKGTKGAVEALTNGDKSATAEFLETMVNGTSRNDWLTTMRTPKDAERVLKDMNKMVSWQKARAQSSVIDPVDPLTNELTKYAQGAMTLAKERSMRQYKAGMDVLESSGATTNAKVDLTQAAADFKMTLGGLGLLRDEAGEIQLTRRARPGSEEIMQVFDAKSIRTLEKIFDQMKTVTRTETDQIMGELAPKKIVAKPLSFEDTKKLLSGIDDILESSGYYKGGDAAMSNNARRALMKLRAQVNEKMVESLGDKKVRDAAGRLIPASQHYRNVAQKYSAFRQVYDDYALPGKFGGSDQRAAQTVSSMLGDKGGNLEKSFQQMLQVSGVDATAVIPRMQQLRAARNLSDIYAPGATGLGAVVKGQLGIGSPRAMARTMAEQTIEAGTKSMRKIAPVSPQHKTMVEATARGYDWVSKLPISQKVNLLANPIMMREFGQAILSAPQTQSMMQQQFLEQAGAPQ